MRSIPQVISIAFTSHRAESVARALGLLPACPRCVMLVRAQNALEQVIRRLVGLSIVFYHGWLDCKEQSFIRTFAAGQAPRPCMVLQKPGINAFESSPASMHSAKATGMASIVLQHRCHVSSLAPAAAVNNLLMLCLAAFEALGAFFLLCPAWQRRRSECWPFRACGLSGPLRTTS